MEDYNIIKVCENKNLIQISSEWFSLRWDVPQSAYFESMINCTEQANAVPQWYVVLDQDKIIAGLGVIENDFHDRKDLSPNVCAIFVENEYRKQGIAGKLLNFVCEDMHTLGIDTLYLVTDHTSFYERYDWKFLCLAQGEGDPEMIRMYMHKYE